MPSPSQPPTSSTTSIGFVAPDIDVIGILTQGWILLYISKMGYESDRRYFKRKLRERDDQIARLEVMSLSLMMPYPSAISFLSTIFYLPTKIQLLWVIDFE